MFTEYGEAVTLHAGGKDSGERNVLAEARPALQRVGCDVAPLF